MENESGFLGQGWAFPPGFSLESKTAILVDDEVDIRQSLTILLSTQLGERVMQPNFGCNLQSVVFEKADKPTITFIRDMIETSILYYEPRIRLLEVNVIKGVDREQEGKIMLEIIYLIRATNTRTNLVFPFYLTEATNPFFNP